MRSRERRERIVQLVRDAGELKVETLAEKFSVTASTIRRDISVLSGEQRVLRTLGGVTAPTGGMIEPSFDDRALEALALKQQLARWTVQLIGERESIMIDAGTTLAALARELDPRWRGTVTTTSLLVLNELAASSVALRGLGGLYRRESRSFVGPGTEDALESLTFDRAFFSADGVSAEHGLCEADERQTHLKRQVARRSRHRYVLAHRDKIGQGALHCWVHLPEPWTLVTNEGADEQELTAFRSRGIEVVLVGSDGTGTVLSPHSVLSKEQRG